MWEGHIKRRDVVWLNIKIFWLKLQKLGRIKNSKMWTINFWVAMFHVSLYLWQWQLSRRALKAHYSLLCYTVIQWNQIWNTWIEFLWLQLFKLGKYLLHECHSSVITWFATICSGSFKQSFVGKCFSTLSVQVSVKLPLFLLFVCLFVFFFFVCYGRHRGVLVCALDSK